MILNNSKRKPNKTWVDQGSEFYTKSSRKWLEDDYIETYSTYNEGKSVVAERFVRTLKIFTNRLNFKKDLQTYESCAKKMFISMC